MTCSVRPRNEATSTPEPGLGRRLAHDVFQNAAEPPDRPRPQPLSLRSEHVRFHARPSMARSHPRPGSDDDDLSRAALPRRHRRARARFRPADAPPDLAYPSGGTVHYLARADDTGRQFGLYRWEMSAEPSGPGPHFHRTISESFYILSGTVRLTDGERTIDATPGDFLFVPGGRHPRLSQRVGRTGLDAAAIRARRRPRGLLRDPGPRSPPASG